MLPKAIERKISPRFKKRRHKEYISFCRRMALILRARGRVASCYRDILRMRAITSIPSLPAHFHAAEDIEFNSRLLAELTPRSLPHAISA